MSELRIYGVSDDYVYIELDGTSGEAYIGDCEKPSVGTWGLFAVSDGTVLRAVFSGGKWTVTQEVAGSAEFIADGEGATLIGEISWIAQVKHNLNHDPQILLGAAVIPLDNRV